MKRRSLRQRFHVSLRKQFIMLILIISLVTFGCMVSVSGYAISTIMDKKIKDNFKVNLNQTMLSLENNIKNLNYVSQQLAEQGTVGKLVLEFLNETNLYRQSELISQINSQLGFISFTNPNIGFRVYYLKDSDTYMFESLPMKPGGNILDLPMIDSYYKINYYGPHISLSYVSDQYVISAIRQVDFPDIHDVYVYIESDFRLTQNILESTHLVANTYSLMLDQEGRVVYSEIPDIFPIDTMFHQNNEERKVDGDEEFGKNKDYYWFKQISNQGWSVVSVISMKDYNMERNNWITSMIITYFVLLLFSGVLGILMWKVIHFSLKRFEKEIELVANNQLTEHIEPMGVPEFDALMTQFLKMKGEIRRLIREIGQKEKRRADLEIEKLRYQINPHFLMNTLNTIHWMAVINKQPGIDKTIMSLNKLLAYNLGKDGFQSTIENEINAVKEYVYLQQSKLKFDFDIQCNIPEEYLLTKTPRFIIQPLVENAIFHGIKKGGQIWITIDMDKNITIGIHDNGKGMQFDLNLDYSGQSNESKDDIHMGIGIRYVIQALHSFYGKKAKFEVKSKSGEGTSVYIRIPFQGMDDMYA